VPASDKRQRKKDNARMAREAREAAVRRRKRLRTVRNVAIIAAVAIIGIVVINLITGDDDSDASSATTTVETTEQTTPTTVAEPVVELTGFDADAEKTYTATIDTGKGRIVVELDAENAPKAAGRFIELARKGFYDGLIWHRLVKDFIIQSGSSDPETDAGSGNPPVVGEVPTDNYPVGTIGAAKTDADPPGTFDSQFFIVTGSQGSQLENNYARFGRVTQGLEVAQQIEALIPPGGGQPTEQVKIDKVTIAES
jgi:cyclophilin family peptidyl-prolyl cis-trans isomerase